MSNNSAWEAAGIHMYGGTGNLTNCTISGNHAVQSAGALESYSGTLALTNTTVSGNSSGGLGGGIVNEGSISLVNTTVSGNSARQLANYSDASRATLKNTLIAQSEFPGSCFGAFTSLGGNFSDDESCSFGPGRDKVNILLGPLAKNGGFTETHLPQPGSPAINNGIASGRPGPRSTRLLARRLGP